jgi:hypothetical protein
MRAASALWKLVGDQYGAETRDGLWSHRDLMPTAEDLDDPLEFAERLGNKGGDDLDPIAELERTAKARQPEEGASESEPEKPAEKTDEPGEDKA